MNLKCMIIDDEPPAHQVLEKYISKLSSLSLAGNCYNAIEAIDFLHQESVDIIFLDINMPEMTGLDFLKTLHNQPSIILTTAYSEFALEGYEYGVQDYLLKPIRFERFAKAVNRIIENKKTDSPSQKTSNNIQTKELFFFIKANGIKHKVNFSEILYAEAYGNFVKIHLPESTLTTASTLTNMEEKLKTNGFLRIHKSFIINIENINSIQGNQVIIGNMKIPIGQSYRQIVLNVLSSKK
ncbi:response regulator transcription factor [Aquimarina sp. 2201CG5-10]|uniref:LytR/AlgR family response regulator transcription factor n=1 Tax=Aquimarina callyspongiae TaxID=3098150 RepID=UPI002AB43FC8|nr:response regulator transcription factor [Aquimarina sp. 2201CG5-10]MDY8137051.1 response regulator transcription factor [Aquimarina sp. 2201CG5-10]